MPMYLLNIMYDSSLCHSFKDKLLQRRGLPCIAAMTSFCSWLASAPPCSPGVFYSSCGKFVCRNARLTGPCPSSGRGWWRRWRALDGRWFLSKHHCQLDISIYTWGPNAGTQRINCSTRCVYWLVLFDWTVEQDKKTFRFLKLYFFLFLLIFNIVQCVKLSTEPP